MNKPERTSSMAENGVEIEVNPAYCYEASPEYCDERAVEVPWTIEVARRIARERPEGLLLLDVGCHSSRHLLPLLEEGIKIEGLDIQECPTSLFKTYRGDIRSFSLSGRYDLITCVSTLEHVGFEVYGGKASKDWFAEQVNAVTAMKKALKKDGLLLLTLPLGRFGLFPSHVNYDLPLFERLIKEAGFEALLLEMYHFDFNERAWRKSPPDEPNPHGYAEGVRFATGVLLTLLQGQASPF